MTHGTERGCWRRWVWSPLAAGFGWFPSTVATLVRRRTGRTSRGAALLSLLPSLLAFIAALLVVYLVYAGWLYPLRPETFPHLAHPFTSVEELSGAWGGDYLAGAWLGHAAIGTGIQLVSLLVLHGLLKARDAIARRGLNPSSNG